MADFSALIQRIKDAVYENGVQAISGQILQDCLKDVVNTVNVAKQDGIYRVTVTVDNNTGVPSATASMDDDTYTLEFSFHNLKGEKGDKGDKGDTPVLTADSDGVIYSDGVMLTRVIKDTTDALTTRADSDHARAESDHARAETDHTDITRARGDAETAASEATYASLRANTAADNADAAREAIQSDLAAKQDVIPDLQQIRAGATDTVKYSTQSLTDAQKEQARTNIGAASDSEVSQLRSEVFGNIVTGPWEVGSIAPGTTHIPDYSANNRIRMPELVCEKDGNYIITCEAGYEFLIYVGNKISTATWSTNRAVSLVTGDVFRIALRQDPAVDYSSYTQSQINAVAKASGILISGPEIFDKALPFTQFGLPGVKKDVSLADLKGSSNGDYITANLFSEFFLDMKLYGTPETNTEYRFDYFQHRTQSGGATYCNYIRIVKSTDGFSTYTNVVSESLGALPPSGIVLHEFTPSNSTLNKIELLLNWDAISQLNSSGFADSTKFASYSIPKCYKPEMSYLLNQEYGVIPVFKLLRETSGLGKQLAVLHNGLPMIDKINSAFNTIVASGRVLTPRVLSNFLLDMHFVGTPTTGCKYVLSGFQYQKNGTASYANYLYIRRINADSTVTNLANVQIGANAPSGVIRHTVTLSDDTGVTQCILLLNWDALAEIESGNTSYSYFKLTENGYVFDQSYLFGDIGKLSADREIANLRSDVDVLQSEVGGEVNINIPPIVYAIAGTELNIWNDSIALSSDKGLYSPINYQVRWSCNKGTITDRCFRYTPADGEAGNDYSCTCEVYNNNFILLAQKTFTIRVKAKDALATAKKIALFGDSLGASTASQLYGKFQNSSRFSGVAPTMIGTRGSSVKYDAVGGFRWVDYATKGSYAYRVSVNGVTSVSVGSKYSITISGTSKTLTVREVNIVDGSGNILLEADYGAKVNNFPSTGTLSYISGTGDATISFTDGFEESGNPLWNDQTNQLDVAQYKQLCGLQPTDMIDAVSFQFGINDAFNADTITGYISALYNAFIADNPNCKFIVALPTTMGNDANGWGVNYGAGGGGYIAYKKKMYNFQQLYLTLLASGDYPNMRMATPGLEVDRYYGYDFSSRQISQEYTTTEQYHNNAVHPGNSGYSQIGDAYLACYVGVLTE